MDPWSRLATNFFQGLLDQCPVKGWRVKITPRPSNEVLLFLFINEIRGKLICNPTPHFHAASSRSISVCRHGWIMRSPHVQLPIIHCCHFVWKKTLYNQSMNCSKNHYLMKTTKHTYCIYIEIIYRWNIYPAIDPDRSDLLHTIRPSFWSDSFLCRCHVGSGVLTKAGVRVKPPREGSNKGSIYKKQPRCVTARIISLVAVVCVCVCLFLTLVKHV